MESTIAEHFASDSRVLEGKRLLLEVLADHQKRLTGIRPAIEDRVLGYHELVTKFGERRGGSLFFPYLGSGFGKGSLVELADGSVKYDFISGIGVHHWGHSHPRIVEAAMDAALKDTVMQGNLQQNVESVTLAKTLLEGANGKGAHMDHCFFSTSGAMANENALKILFQKRFPADRILVFDRCFMGRTLALAQVTDKPGYREGLPPTLRVDYVPFYDPSNREQSIEDSLNCLKHHLARHPNRHAAMVFELIQGEGGFNAGAREFFLPLMDELKHAGVPILIDEVQTFGRTTELFAFQHFELDPYVDVVTLGKAAQVCATLFADEFKPRPGLLSQTFTAGTAAIMVSQVVVRGLIDGGYFGPDGKIARIHEHCIIRLQEIQNRLPHLIGGIHGVGAMIAFTPYGGDPNKVKAFIHALFDAGVICFYAGSDRLRVRYLLPVAAVTEQDIDAVVAVTEKTLAGMAG